MKRFFPICISVILCLNISNNIFAAEQDYEEHFPLKSIDSGYFEPGSKGALGIDLETGVETSVSPEDLIEISRKFDENCLLDGSGSNNSDSSLRSTPTGKYKGVVIVEADTPYGPMKSSGFMVGPTGVATSAHSIYDRYGNGWYKDIRIYTLADKGNYGQKIKASYAAIGSEYQENDRDDWGVLELSYAPNNYYYFGLESNNGTDRLVGTSVTAIGYASVNGSYSNLTDYAQKRVSGTVLGRVGNKSLIPLATNCKIVDGMSGGPLILGNNNAIAINKKIYPDLAEHMLINDWLLGALLKHSGR